MPNLGDVITPDDVSKKAPANTRLIMSTGAV